MEAFQEAKKARDADFDDLMAACDFAISAAKNGESIAPCVMEMIKGEKESPLELLEEDFEREDRRRKLNILNKAGGPEPVRRFPLPKPIPQEVMESPRMKRKEARFAEEMEERKRERSEERKKIAQIIQEPQQAEKDDNGFVYYKCRFCGLTYNYMNTLRAHERVHNVPQPFVCGKCGESFEFSCQLEYHCMQHGDVSGYKCECGRTFFSYTEMLYHKHADEGDKEDEKLHAPPMIVASPSAPTANPALLLHEMPTPEFAEKGYEPKHPLKVYNDVRAKPYICEYCSKSYADSRGLAYHMYSHRGEKMFNPRASRYMMGREGVGYTDRRSYHLFPYTSGYVPPTL